MNNWQFHLSNWQGVGPVWAFSFSFVYTGLNVWAFIQSQKLNLTYCLNSSLLLTFCPLIVCMAHQSQMYPLSISPLGLSQGIICNIPSVTLSLLSPPPSPLAEGGLEFLKNHKREDQNFTVKIKGSSYKRAVYRKGVSTAFN